MFRLLIDDTEYGLYNTKEEALEARKNAVRDWLYELYNNDDIDKYAVEDWMWGIKDCKDDHYYVQEHCGRSFDIMEVK